MNDRFTAYKDFPYPITVNKRKKEEHPPISIVENLKNKNFSLPSIFGPGFPYYKLFQAEDQRYNIYYLNQDWRYVYFLPSPIDIRFISKIDHKLYWIPFNTFIPVNTIDYIILSMDQPGGVWNWDAYFQYYLLNEIQAFNPIHFHSYTNKWNLVNTGGDRGLVSLSPVVSPLKLNILCAEPNITIEIRIYPFKDDVYFTVLPVAALGSDPFNKEYKLPPSFKVVVIFRNETAADAWVYYNATGIYEWLLQELWFEICDCDSLNNWIGTALSLDSTDKKQGLFSIKDDVATPALETAYDTNYNPIGTWDLSKQKYLRFWLKSDKANTNFASCHIYIYDTQGHWNRWNLVFAANTWVAIDKPLQSPDNVSGITDLSKINIIWVRFRTLDPPGTAFYKKIDFIRTMN